MVLGSGTSELLVAVAAGIARGSSSGPAGRDAEHAAPLPGPWDAGHGAPLPAAEDAEHGAPLPPAMEVAAWAAASDAAAAAFALATVAHTASSRALAASSCCLACSISMQRHLPVVLPQMRQGGCVWRPARRTSWEPLGLPALMGPRR